MSKKMQVTKQVYEALEAEARKEGVTVDELVSTLVRKDKKKGDSVTVTIELPRSLHDFMRKIAGLEGLKPEDWYVRWLSGDFEAFLDNFHGSEFDLKALVEVNGLRETLEERNSSFVRELYKSDC